MMSEYAYYESLRVSDRLNQAYENQDKSIREIANNMGIFYETVYGYVNFLSIPHLSRLILLAKELDVSLDWLMFGGEKESFQDVEEDHSGLFKFKSKHTLTNAQHVIRSTLKKHPERSVRLCTIFDINKQYGVCDGRLFWKNL